MIRVETDAQGRANRVVYLDSTGTERAQAARSVILSANGAETPRLLLMSESSRHPDGLANSSGFVGRNLMHNAHSLANGIFEQPLNDYKGPQVTRVIHHLTGFQPAGIPAAVLRHAHPARVQCHASGCAPLGGGLERRHRA